MTKLITALKITGEIIFIVLGGIELKESIEKLRNQRRSKTHIPYSNHIIICTQAAGTRTFTSWLVFSDTTAYQKT